MKLIVLLAFITFAATSWGQPPACASQELSQEFLLRQRSDPVLHFIPAANDDRGGTITIPVVVHVVWNTPAENLPDAMIHTLLQQLNADFRLQNADAAFVRPAFQSVQADVGIAFCLAAEDPLGNATTGITRTFTSTTWFDPGTAPDAMKAPPLGTSPWDPYHYLNIWVCDISSGAAPGSALNGFAYLPVAGIPGSSVDGVVLDSQLAFAPPARTATHEVGHYLGSLHPWGMLGACIDDDGLADTPPTDSPTAFCTDPNLIKCGALTQYENFMDLSVCPLLFTTEQAAVMQAVLAGPRSALGTTLNCLPMHDPERIAGSDCPPLHFLGEGRIAVEDRPAGTTVRVVDVLGRHLTGPLVGSTLFTLPRAGLAPGVLFLLVEDASRCCVYRTVIVPR